MVPRLSDRKGRSIGRLIPALLVILAAGLPVVRPAAAQFSPGDTTSDRADRQLSFDTNLGLLERATREAVDKALAGLRLPPGSEVRLHSLTDHEGSWFVEDFIARALSERGCRIYLARPESPAATGPAGAGTPATGTNPAASGATSMADAVRASQSAAPDSAGPSLGASVTGSSGAADSAAAAQAASRVTGNIGQRPNPFGPRTGSTGAAGAIGGEEKLNPVPEGEGLVLTFRVVEFSVTYHDSWRRGFMGPRVVERLASVDVYTRLVSGGAENVLWVGGGQSQRLDVVPKAKLDLLEGMSYPFKAPVLPARPLSRILEPALVLGIVGGLVFLFYSNQN